MPRAGRKVMLTVLGAVVATLAYVAWREPSLRTSRLTQRPVQIPEFSAQGQAGRVAFQLHCASCHGQHALGGTAGPPLVDPVYRPAHHGDIAFTLAVRRGVRAHHWRFGDMPPQPSVSDADVANITRYVRELQRVNGIE